jgi:hypothetical protein
MKLFKIATAKLNAMTKKSPLDRISSDHPGKFIFADRYSATGIEPPVPGECCPGQCEGMGVVLVTKNDRSAVFRALWRKAEIEKPTKDGYHFVVCPRCLGSGKKKYKSKQ